MPPKIAILADARPESGGGHVMRCWYLSKALQYLGVEVLLGLVGSANGVFSQFKEHTGNAVVVSHLEDRPAMHLDWLKYHSPDRLLIDSYSVGQEECRAYLDVSPHAYRFYDQRGNEDLGMGALYPHDPRFRGILDPDWLGPRQMAFARRERGYIDHVLISFGMVDRPGSSFLALNALSRYRQETHGKFEIHLVVGKANLQSEALELAGREWGVRVYRDLTDMGFLYALCDAAIGAPGVSGWERCAYAIPSILIQNAENQASSRDVLIKAGAAWGGAQALSVTEADLYSDMKQNMFAPERYLAAMRAADALCDGQGVFRLAAAVLGDKGVMSC